MRKIAVIAVAILIVASGCGPKAYYKTAKGKKKQKYYNELQYGGKSAATYRKVK